MRASATERATGHDGFNESVSERATGHDSTSVSASESVSERASESVSASAIATHWFRLLALEAISFGLSSLASVSRELGYAGSDENRRWSVHELWCDAWSFESVEEASSFSCGSEACSPGGGVVVYCSFMCAHSGLPYPKIYSRESLFKRDKIRLF